MILIGLKIYVFVQNLLFYIIKSVNFFKKSEKLNIFLSLRDPDKFLDSVQKAAHIFEKIQTNEPDARIFWFHVASAGELEQVVTLAHVLHQKMQVYFFVTYYSPSAIPFLKNMPWCLGSSGLPIDSINTYKKAYQILPFQKLFFVRYDLWPGLVFFAVRHGLELNLLCATKIKTSTGILAFLSEKWNLFLYKKFQNIFVAFQQDMKFFTDKLSHQRIVFTGDTKWQRAWQRAQNFQKNLSLYAANEASNSDDFFDFFLAVQKHIKINHLKCLVLGSPHQEEHDIALQYLMHLKDKILMIYVPHKISDDICFDLQKKILNLGGKTCFYSDFKKTSPLTSHNVIIVNSMGYLAELYALADIAIIGGGFDGQIHNVLEPTAHGVPIAIGTNISRAPEAKILADSKVAFTFSVPNLLFQFLVQWGTLGMHMKELQYARDEAIPLFKGMPNTNEIILNILLQEMQHDNKTIDH